MWDETDMQDEHPNVLALLNEEQWVGTDEEVVQAITLLANVLLARANRT